MAKTYSSVIWHTKYKTHRVKSSILDSTHRIDLYLKLSCCKNHQSFGLWFDLNSTKCNNINNIDILIDVTSGLGLKSILSYLITNKINIPLISGTTGDLPYNVETGIMLTVKWFNNI